MPTLVARITLLRLLPVAIHLPRIVSDSPPVCPGAQAEYTSAVSMKFNPASRAASSRRNESASETVHPNTFPPRQITGTSRSDFPSLTRCIAILQVLVCHVLKLQFAPAFHGARHRDFVRIFDIAA